VRKLQEKLIITCVFNVMKKRKLQYQLFSEDRDLNLVPGFLL